MAMLFIFDMDEVLYDYDWRVRMAGLTVLTGRPLDELRRAWWHDEGEWAAEAGRFATGDDYLAAFCQTMGIKISRSDWLANRASAMSPRPHAIDAARRASEFGQVTLLTNNGPLAGEHLAELAPELLPVFGADHLFASSHYGARKPNPAVFLSVLEAYDADPATTFFADDMRINVEGARSVGISAHHFETTAGLHNAIDEFVASQALTH